MGARAQPPLMPARRRDAGTEGTGEEGLGDCGHFGLSRMKTVESVLWVAGLVFEGDERSEAVNREGGLAGQTRGYRSWRRKTLLRLSLTMSSSSVSCSLAMRGMSSRTRCCMARHVRLSSYQGRKRDNHGHAE